jgi:SagB-type dehydrogenase family enzyme
MLDWLPNPDCPFELALVRGTQIVVSGNTTVGRTESGPLILPPLLPGHIRSVDLLNQGRVRASALFADLNNQELQRQLSFFLQVLAENQLLEMTVAGAALRSTSRFFTFADSTLNIGNEYQLSRFAYLRTDREKLLLESPLVHCHIELTDADSLPVLYQLRKRISGAAIMDDSLGPRAREISLLLLFAGFLDEAGGSEREAAYAHLRQWEFHDLLFHATSRVGRHGKTVGGSYRFKGKTLPPSPAKTYGASASIALPRANLEWLSRCDAPLTAVLEHRKSVRRRGRVPISRQDLGEFLFRTARVRAAFDANGMTCTSRPYPGGGACHELEIYLVVDDCSCLAPGVYHYDAVMHALAPVASASAQTRKLLTDASGACAAQFTPEVLLVITARFARLSWKYESIAYATILKDVGVLYQTMYLVATSMGLGPCALGCGDSDVFSRVIGSDYCQETSVGEFMLNGRA